MKRVKDRYGNVACIGMDVHYKFSQVGMRDLQGGLVCRERLDHPGRGQLRERLSAWPKGVPIVLEASFGRGAEVELAPGALATLRGQVRMLDQVRGMLAEAAGRLRKELARTPLARRLDGIPGIGLILSHTLLAEIGQIERFRNHRALAKYCLLGPISEDTGEEDGSVPLGRHLGRRGNKTLRWAMIEAAHGAVRSGGRWRAMFDRQTEGGKSNRNRGYIKVARELVKVVYVAWRRDVEYTETPPARPGSGQSQRRPRAQAFYDQTRSDTGQPCVAMVPGR